MSVLGDKTDSGLLSSSRHPQDASQCCSQALVLLPFAYCT